MKKRIYFIAIVLGLIAAIFFFNRVKDTEPVQEKGLKEEIIANQSQEAKPQEGSSEYQELENYINENKELISSDKWVDLHLGANQEIEFYGKVVDQFGSPVTGAKVDIQTSAHSIEYAKDSGDGVRREREILTSDRSGLFSFQGASGLTFQVMSISKDGYREHFSPVTESSFAFGKYYGGKHKPNPKEPVIYSLWKKQGANESVIKGSMRSLVNPDKTVYYVDLENSKISQNRENADFSFTVLKRQNGIEKVYYWSCELNSIDGGVQVDSTIFPFEAPIDGYQSKLIVQNDPKTKMSDWESESERSYYFKSKGGRHYSNVRIRVRSNYNEKSAVYIHYILSRNGSRNLETKAELSSHFFNLKN